MIDPLAESAGASRTRRGGVADMLARIRSAFSGRRNAVAGLNAELLRQRELIEEQASSLMHSNKIFDRASEAARIGVWECSLPDHELRWTDVVYDLFDLPRGSPLDRREIVKCYPDESRRVMEEIRSRAIEERSGFSLDAEITTCRGRQRWIRITATVECENGVPVRIFGMKQDITEEKILADRNRYLAEFDVMTGLSNRSRFQQRLEAKAPMGALLLVDLDGFKAVNDTLGHVAGDECLREAARRIEFAARSADLVARLGGDEFAIVLGPQVDRASAADLARSIVMALAEPVRLSRHSVTIGASVGVAFAAGGKADDLYTQADTALYAAKDAGRGTFRVFKPVAISGGTASDTRAA